MSSLTTQIIIGVVCYLIGNISPAILIGKLKGKDVRKLGSGNAGTTNVLRNFGFLAALVTLLIDIGKGVLAVYLGYRFGNQDYAMICGLLVIIGHIWPILFGLKGGKGVATMLGVLLMVEPLMCGIAVAVCLVMILLSRRISVGSICAGISLPIIGWFLDPKYVPWCAIITVIVLLKHRANIKRLIRREEPAFSLSSKRRSRNV